MLCLLFVCFFVFKQKTAYEMRISDWSSDVCSSDLDDDQLEPVRHRGHGQGFVDERILLLTQRAAVDGDRHELHALAVEHQRAPLALAEIGRASCRERVCQYV